MQAGRGGAPPPAGRGGPPMQPQQQQPQRVGRPGAQTAVAPSIVIPPEEVDFDFLPLIVEILRLVEDGHAGSEGVKSKVEYLQAKFIAAKAALEGMDGADLSEDMQLETFDIYS
eukprot:CAMPEP_0114145404 /NCGR_PEP_ID=MMETSP0043_2-20121206/20031_1 /TAXON_ID=464988 /ORGANISM="Hemiselmis andersenii, Strain CCMP644" /LENGTH=113 /DNA_ID=CAMNT_0001239825 /DNA_START=44 /DNA_END=381 /DNA_ORIENTATION=+